MTGGVAAAQLKSIVERVERLEEEKKALSDDIRDVYAEAKANGLDIIYMTKEAESVTQGEVGERLSDVGPVAPMVLGGFLRQKMEEDSEAVRGVVGISIKVSVFIRSDTQSGHEISR